jgi:hypothetical protein
MQQVADSILMGMQQLMQGFQASQAQNNQTMQMLVAAITAPKERKAIFENGRIVGSTEQMRLQ